MCFNAIVLINKEARIQANDQRWLHSNRHSAEVIIMVTTMHITVSFFVKKNDNDCDF